MECIVFFGNIEPTFPEPLVPYIRAISMFIRWNTIKVKKMISLFDKYLEQCAYLVKTKFFPGGLHLAEVPFLFNRIACLTT